MTPSRAIQTWATAGRLWCLQSSCLRDGERQPLHQTEHDATLYRCSCCGTDWTLAALAAQALVEHARMEGALKTLLLPRDVARDSEIAFWLVASLAAFVGLVAVAWLIGGGA